MCCHRIKTLRWVGISGSVGCGQSLSHGVSRIQSVGNRSEKHECAARGAPWHLGTFPTHASASQLGRALSSVESRALGFGDCQMSWIINRNLISLSPRELVSGFWVVVRYCLYACLLTALTHFLLSTEDFPSGHRKSSGYDSESPQLILSCQSSWHSGMEKTRRSTCKKSAIK